MGQALTDAAGNDIERHKLWMEKFQRFIDHAETRSRDAVKRIGDWGRRLISPMYRDPNSAGIFGPTLSCSSQSFPSATLRSASLCRLGMTRGGGESAEWVARVSEPRLKKTSSNRRRSAKIKITKNQHFWVIAVEVAHECQRAIDGLKQLLQVSDAVAAQDQNAAPSHGIKQHRNVVLAVLNNPVLRDASTSAIRKQLKKLRHEMKRTISSKTTMG